MARLVGPDESGRLVYRADGTARAQGLTGTVYADAGGTQLADILTEGGGAVPGSQVTVDAYSKLPLFQFPDGLDTVYVTVNGGPLVAVYARTDDRIDAKVDKSISRVSAADFGAAGDNTADDTAACQAAIDALPLGGGEVHFPTGTYKLSAALVLASGVSLAGDGDVTIVLRQTSTSASCVTGVNVERVGLRNLQLLGPGSGTGHGLSLTRGGGSNTAYVTLENVTVDDFGGDGVRIENPIVTALSRVVVSSNGGYGINLFGQNGGAAGTSCSLSACYGNANTTAGIRLYNMVYAALNGCAADHNGIGYLVDACQSVSFAGCGGEGNTTAGFKVNAGYGVTLVAPWIYDNRGVGVWVSSSAAAVTLVGAIDNTPAGSATAFIKVDSGCKAALVNCNNTTVNSLAAGTTSTLASGSGDLVTTGNLTAGGDTLTLAGDGTLTRPSAFTLRAANNLQVGSTLQHQGSNLGFFNTAAISKPTVSGSRANPEQALASLIAAVANLGLITNSTTA